MWNKIKKNVKPIAFGFWIVVCGFVFLVSLDKEQEPSIKPKYKDYVAYCPKRKYTVFYDEYGEVSGYKQVRYDGFD